MATVPCHPTSGGAEGGTQSGGSCSLDGMQVELTIFPEQLGELSHVSTLDSRACPFPSDGCCMARIGVCLAGRVFGFFVATA